MVEGEDGLVAFQILDEAGLAFGDGATQFLQKGLAFAHLLHNRLVQQVLNVLGKVERLVGVAVSGGAFLVERFARVNALENAEPAKVRQRQLQLANGPRARDVIGGSTAFALLDELSHGFGEKRRKEENEKSLTRQGSGLFIDGRFVSFLPIRGEH